MVYALWLSDFDSMASLNQDPSLGWKVSTVSSKTGVRYISTILTINIETVKLFHVRTDRRTGL